jgi:hypothetical protein
MAPDEGTLATGGRSWRADPQVRDRILARPTEVAMQLQLTDQEAYDLHDLLHDYLPALQREVARTDAKVFRHVLVQRLDLAERILNELSTEVTRLTPR